METKKYKAKRLGNSAYIYRGYRIKGYPNEGFFSHTNMVWEAVDENGCGFAHSETLRECKAWVDDAIEKENLHK